MNREWDKQTALNKAARFCAYQERSIEEVRKKLLSRLSRRDIAEEIIEELIAQDFLNEERFTESFVKGKFFMKKWGKTKISYALKAHHISQDTVEKIFFEVIPEDEYIHTLSELMRKKISQLNNRPPLEIKGKVFRHLAAKGYEQDIIYQEWNKQGLDV